MKTRVFIGAGAAVLALGGLAFAWSHSGGYAGHHMHHGTAQSSEMHQHDEVNMPGLRGENASAEESAEIAVLFRNFDTITREVENLPDGIRTVTRSSDPAVMDALVSHSVGMIDRVGQLDDPKIAIQSPTLDLFFVRGDEIRSVVDVTDDGLVITQTSDDPEVVAALQTHAAEVTAMADRGMAAVHQMMMERGQNH